MPNTRISDLTAATSVAGTDVYPSVQTAGVGPVKTSLTDITAFALANAPAGAVATPSIAPTGDTNTGFWFPAADTIAASTGGSERMRINSSGNVGIGTTGPSRRLEVHGTPATIGGDATGMLVSVVNNNTAFNASPTSGISLWNRFNTAGDAFPSAAIQGGKENTTDGNYAGYMSFFTIGAAGGVFERMRINSSGNVGIGTTSPNPLGFGNVLTVSDGGSPAFSLMISGASIFDAVATTTASYITTRTATPLVFQTNGSERMRINSSGNVGIGTGATIRAVSKFDVQGYGSFGTNAYGFYIGTDATGGQLDAGPNGISFFTGSSEKMRLTSTGNVLIGTTSSPTTGTQCLTIETETAPTATPADTVTFYSSDLSAGNTMPSFYTEGTIVGTGTPTADRTIAVRINGTVYYLLASTIP